MRTMRSDLESMTRSGGGAPRFENVAVAGLAVQNDVSQQQSSAPAPVPANESPSSAGAPSSSLLGPILVAIVALIAIAVVGYFAYTIFHPSA